MPVPILTLVTITKVDETGLSATLASTRFVRRLDRVQHIVLDGAGIEQKAAEAAGCLWVEQRGRGIAGAFNEGLAAAAGDWVWFLNGGDAIHEDLQAEWLLQHLSRTRADVVIGMIQFEGEAAPRRLPHVSYQWPLIACWLPHPATIVRRELLSKAGGFDERCRVAMDYDLWFRLLKRPIALDVLSIPFTRFDRNGVSERPASRSLATAETANVILRHSGHFVGEGLWVGARIMRRLAWALGAWMKYKFVRRASDGK
ncbi:MAG: glycosyltransferase [Nibricoccus sp.]